MFTPEFLEWMKKNNVIISIMHDGYGYHNTKVNTFTITGRRLWKGFSCCSSQTVTAEGMECDACVRSALNMIKEQLSDEKCKEIVMNQIREED